MKTRHQPTEKTRERVKLLAGVGLPQEQICVLIGLRSAKTLRRYYSKELQLGIAETCTRVAKTAYGLASSGKNPAMTIFFLKTRARWSPGMAVTSQRERDEQLIYIYEDYKLPNAGAAATEGELAL
jgi:transketolase C-terminal domain/subunit